MALNVREAFYQSVVTEQIIDKDASILVCGAGNLDKQVFADLGFNNVTLSNLDERMEEIDCYPFKWKYENAEQLSFNNDSIDYVIIHDAIHHATSPHKVLTELYRVSKIGVLAFESCDSVIMRILEKLKFTQTYEHAAVYFNNSICGGVNNTDIPNYIYRWTEREVEKVIKSYAPYTDHDFRYRYGTAFPCTPELEKKAWGKYILLKTFEPFYWLFVRFFPKQQNLFSFYIQKPKLKDNLFPWLQVNGDKIVFNKEWGAQKYKYPLE